MSDIINQIADAIEAEIHEAWTESDADFNRGMEYAVSIVKAVDIRTDGDLISREDAIAEFRDGRDVYDIMESIEELPSAPSAEAESRLYIKIYADDEPSVMAEKLYQICGETQNREVAEWLKEYDEDMPF